MTTEEYNRVLKINRSVALTTGALFYPDPYETKYVHKITHRDNADEDKLLKLSEVVNDLVDIWWVIIASSAH